MRECSRNDLNLESRDKPICTPYPISPLNRLHSWSSNISPKFHFHRSWKCSKILTIGMWLYHTGPPNCFEHYRMPGVICRVRFRSVECHFCGWSLDKDQSLSLSMWMLTIITQKIVIHCCCPLHNDIFDRDLRAQSGGIGGFS